MTHTPGPWAIEKAQDGVHNISVPDGKAVAFWVGPEDAPLVSAAPEMLEALRRCRRRFVALQAAEPPELDVAIAKATRVIKP